MNTGKHNYRLSVRLWPAFLCGLLLAIVSAAQTPQSQPQSQSQPAIPSTDIFLAGLASGTDRLQIEKPENITRRAGYDNQPSFLPGETAILYTAIDDSGQADTYRYDLKKRASEHITKTAESEYSPTLTPDGTHISVVRVEPDTTQRLWEFPLNGGAPRLLLPDVKPVGYHIWLDANHVVVYVLGEPATLQRVDIATGNSTVIATDVGRCLQHIPRSAAISFVQIVSEEQALIKQYDPKTGATTDLMPAISGSEDFAWTPDGRLVMGKGSKLFFAKPGSNRDWKEFADISSAGIKTITRLAISPSGKQLALVADD